MNIIVLYHANCTDGAGSMWAAWKHFKNNATYIAVGHESKTRSSLIKKCKNADEVYMCDIMLNVEHIKEIVNAKTIVYLLDHHISNINEYTDAEWKPHEYEYIKYHCDLEKSGAGITWDYFHPNHKRPTIINHVEDVDLWRWALPHGEEIQTYLHQYNWNSNNVIIDTFNNLEELSTDELCKLGAPILKYKKQLMKRSMTQVGRADIDVDDIVYNVPILNTNQFISETANEMAINEPFAVIWQQAKNGEIRLSLRSDKQGRDVSKISGKLGLGGGGHEHAAGTRFSNMEKFIKTVKFKL